MDLRVALTEQDQAGGRLRLLEGENARLRRLLSQAMELAGIASERNVHLGHVVETERVAAETNAALYQRDLEDGAARLADAEGLNLKLKVSEEFARRILWSTNDFVAMLDLDGGLLTMSENGPSILGLLTAAEATGQPFVDFWICPESRAAVLGGLHAARLGHSNRFKAELEVRDVSTWWDIAVTPIHGADERPERILAVARDITELKNTEARQTLLMQEMAHRMKNTLALVQAVAAQTLRNAESLATAADALSARLLALAQAHDVLVRGSFASAPLRALVETAVTLHGDGRPGRFRIDGPDVTLTAHQGMTLALMLHELGTNATKYGALSTGAGHVAVSWTVLDAAPGGQPVLCFRWEEVDGPAVAPPTRTGFGTRLIARSLAHSFGGSVRLDYPVSGAVLSFESPLLSVPAEPYALQMAG
ncbi:sensor histidine kinase [Methylobacterium sp. J-076]|uniref:sensor histidine kinase n=1 Tax=Methylobacterium sp. J-076 TaxID=2836655 RepID=UPI001FB97C1A|nr:HWE histidine kinase domain-containing protein [Methylobacterium sp. J-076]MCJ2015327.1 PAS domain S-box protein [Methylobacterium sp. J-076]